MQNIKEGKFFLSINRKIKKEGIKTKIDKFKLCAFVIAMAEIYFLIAIGLHLTLAIYFARIKP
jgi:hypothetical protein